MHTVGSYAVYLALSLGAAIWVAQTLFKNGRVFLLEAFGENERLADSVNHLLVVGFYLVNLGYVSLALKYGRKPEDLEGAFEFVSTKIGLVLLILGAMHFFNLYVLSRFRRRGGAPQAAPAAPAPPPPQPGDLRALVEQVRKETVRWEA